MSTGIVIAVDSNGIPVNPSASASISVSSLLAKANAKHKQGEARVFYLDSSIVATVNIGNTANLNEIQRKEKSREAAAAGVKLLRGVGCTTIQVDPVFSSHAASTGATLATFKYDLKTSKAAVQAKSELAQLKLEQLGEPIDTKQTENEKLAGHHKLDWKTGVIYAEAQNLSRELAETPANLMTPTIFCQRAVDIFRDIPNVTVNVHDKAWAQEKGMRTFLSVAAGSDEPCKFLEIIYKGNTKKPDAQPVAFVGKGITFDSGGISIKPAAGMDEMRSDMQGASCLLSSLYAIAKMQLPLNIVMVSPLTENMPSGKATKPGDVITTMNGISVTVDNTDAEGRLVLADALYYASSVYKPSVVIDVATLTGAMMIALGEVYTGAFVNGDKLWSEIEAAGAIERDRYWRMPLDDEYMANINKVNGQMSNTGGRPAGSCNAAIFLQEFVDGLRAPDNHPEGEEFKPTIEWAHLDIAGVMSCSPQNSYDYKGMNGRSVRPLIEWARRRASKQ